MVCTICGSATWSAVPGISVCSPRAAPAFTVSIVEDEKDEREEQGSLGRRSRDASEKVFCECFGQLMRRADSLEKDLDAGKD